VRSSHAQRTKRPKTARTTSKRAKRPSGLRWWQQWRNCTPGVGRVWVFERDRTVNYEVPRCELPDDLPATVKAIVEVR